MTYQIFDDIFDLLRLRPQPLAHYRYPVWQPALLITLIGVFGAASADALQAPLTGKIVYFIGLQWLHLLLLAQFFHWWLRRGDRWNGEGSLWQLFAACQGLSLLGPLLSWFPDAMLLPLASALSAYGVVIVIHALTVATQVARNHVIGGVLLFWPISLLLSRLMLAGANQLGWLPEPPAEKPAVTQPKAGHSTQAGK